MGFETSSSIFNGIRAGLVDGGLSKAQLKKIVQYIDRSSIFTRRIREFEQSGGQVEYETSEKNYFWLNEGVPTVYVSPAYKNGAAGESEPNIDVLTKVLAHEMSHFETYHKNNDGFNPNNKADADAAGAAGVRDEARAYALEYLIESEINQTEPRVEWMEEGQTAAQKGIDGLGAGMTSEIARLDAATRALLDWAANWTGPTVEAGGYFQFYKNEWFKANPPGSPVAVSEVVIRCNAAGSICEMEYRDDREGPKIVVLDPATGKFAAKLG